MFRSMGQPTTVRERSAARQAAAERAQAAASQPAARQPVRQAASARRYGSVLIGNVQMPTAVPRNDKARKRGLVNLTHLSLDVPLVMALIALLIVGLITVYTASYDYSNYWYGNPMEIFTRQIIWLALGLTVMTVLALMDYHVWQKLAVVAMIGTLAALVLVLLMDVMINYATRTLVKGSIQPSELAKLVMIIYLSVWLYAKRDRLSDVTFGLIPLAAILGILGGLILLQPDLSAVITIMMLGGLMFFLAGGDLKQIGVLLIVAVIVGFLVVQFTSTGSARIETYLAGLNDPTEGSYQIKRSFEAFVRGGLMGVGIGNGEVKLTGLPVPQTDSVFAVWGEETGLLGSLTLLFLYVVFMWRGLTIARRAPDQMGALLAAGLTLWISLEAFINMAVMVNLLPFAGNALPFISSGGSNLVSSLAAVGLILNVSRLAGRKSDKEGTFDAVVSLRGRDGRRRVSGTGRTASPANPVQRSQPRR